MIKLIFCKDKEEVLTAISDREVICLGVDSLFYEAYEELGLSDKKLNVIGFDDLESMQKIQIGNREIVIDSIDELKNITDSTVVIAATSLGKYLEVEERINYVLDTKNIDAYLYYAVRNALNLTERAIERQKKIVRRKENLTFEEARKNAERLICPDEVIIPKLNVLVTDKCSLRCKDCRALVPMINNPQDEPLDKVIKEISAILDVVDGIVDVEPIGGEPLLYPYLPELLEYLCSQEKIMNVCLSTNATVIPNNRCLEALKHKKIFIYISDYGYLSKMAEVISVFEAAGISFVVESNQKWSDVGGVEYRKRDINMLKKEYMNCFGQFMVKYVWDNKLWLCPRAPRLHKLNVIDSKHDYIDIFGYENRAALQEAIISSFFENYAESCNYCNQGDADVNAIPAGLQQEGNDKKSRFTIIDRNLLEELLRFKG